ncbi:MAG TPA: 5-methyltetrahydropteroyltriglutamate--homocysteine S-methyltransferase [Xanthobacteraceae bacterium]|nr:5-methyltetrahydropteroyltriglutamate--homocysteine S-methyltransferase [Xanthobacteraceae bacterium]
MRVPPFRADHVGSLLRPPALRQAFRQHAAGEIGDEEFARIQDAAIRDVVRLQEDTGLEVVTDGEFRRGSYWGRFVERLDGLAIRTAAFKFRDSAGQELDFTAPHVVAKVKRARPLALDEFEFLMSVARATPKVTLPAPSTMHFYRCTDYAEPGIYADAEAFFADLAAVYRAEIAALAGAGCRYVQLDEVAIAMLCDPAIRAKISAGGVEPDALVDLYIDGINAAVAGRPAKNMAVGVHMCRGNFRGRYLAEGGYESVAERFFARADVTHFLLEYDTARAGDFRPLRFVPKTKAVVLGLVSSKTPVLEEIDALRRRVDDATKYIDLDRLAISPQCGFASTAAGNPVTEADERAKLARVVEAARMIWD